jgi:methyl-accepting chemotaxis protein
VGRVFGLVVSTINEINASVRKIVDIIGVIDGIAFQPHIQALFRLRQGGIQVRFLPVTV